MQTSQQGNMEQPNIEETFMEMSFGQINLLLAEFPWDDNKDWYIRMT
jgi:valyl-tRNA synthetase